MQEIALFLTGIAGAASAVAYKKFPRTKSQLVSMGASSHIQGKIHSLKVEKDILTKTITRLYQYDAGITKIQRDRLLSKYQHQLGIVLAKIEKLEEAGRHPDLGPIGDGLVTLMDQKLSALDQRLYELSSKIAVANVQVPELKEKSKKEEAKKSEEQKPKEKLPKPVDYTKFDFPDRPKEPVELTTLTTIPNRQIEFPLAETKKSELKEEIIKDVTAPKKVDPQPSLTSIPMPEEPAQELPTQLPKPEPVSDLTSKDPSVKTTDDDDEDDSEELSKLTGEIRKTLSKLEQAEVE